MRVKIAKAQQQKVPFMLVVGDKEAESDTVGVRERTEGDIGAQSIDAFAEQGAGHPPVAHGPTRVIRRETMGTGRAHSAAPPSYVAESSVLATTSTAP